MIFRKAQSKDFPKILALQQQNLFENLSEEERKDGFLSTAFPLEHFENMNAEIGIAVAYENEELAGYLCSSTLELNEKFPFPKAAIAHAKILEFKGKKLSEYSCFFANPLCINKNFRGEGVILGLTATVINFIPKEYNLALSFISKKNPRSLYASKKVGMQEIGSFVLGENEFVVVVREINNQS